MNQAFSTPRNSKPANSHSFGDLSSTKDKLLKDELAESIHQAVRDNRSYLMEHETKEILEGVGIPTTGFLVARSEDEVLTMSEKQDTLLC